MPVITLTSDWKNNDYYVGAMKGRLISLAPSATIIDITHLIQEFEYKQAAFVVRNSYKFYPEGSIHIIAVDRYNNAGAPYLALKANNHFFLSRDTGIFSLLGLDKIDSIVELPASDEFHSFQELSVLANAAAKLANNTDISEIGNSLENIYKMHPLNPTPEPYGLDGHIIHIDTYGNVITNINIDLFNRTIQDKKYAIYLSSYHYKITQIVKTYHEVAQNELFALFNSLGLLELGMVEANAAQLLSLSIGGNVRVKFEMQKVRQNTQNQQNTLF